MGYGDWVMCTAQIKELHEFDGRPIYVIGRGNRPQWSEIFENNPRITRRPIRNAQTLINGSGLRPYIASKSAQRWEWKHWRIAPGEIYLLKSEKDWASRYSGKILIEPNTKVADGNKSWIWDRWQKVVDTMGPDAFIQVGGNGAGNVLRGVEFIHTTFRQACAVLSHSRGFVGTEGGLHHAAAALGKPAVVLFSEFIGIDITGYPGHRNIRHAGPACGARAFCPSCKESMNAITVSEVLENIQAVM